jgi:hypothetical protein
MTAMKESRELRKLRPRQLGQRRRQLRLTAFTKQPTSACGAPLLMKMLAARAGLSEPQLGDRAEADKSAMVRNPDKQSSPRCVEVPFFVALGNEEHA